jgi:hypothetical protein
MLAKTERNNRNCGEMVKSIQKSLCQFGLQIPDKKKNESLANELVEN